MAFGAFKTSFPSYFYAICNVWLLFEFSLNVFTEFAEFSDKYFSKINMIAVLEPRALA